MTNTPRDVREPIKVLFVCVENSCRSQIAEAFAHILGRHAIKAYSAGSRPSGVIHPMAITIMTEVAYDLTRHSSKSLEAFADMSFDAVITMGCGDACPHIPAKLRENWEIPDPRDMARDDFRKVRETIRVRVAALLEQLLPRV